MATVTVKFAPLLAGVAGAAEVRVEAETVAGALEALLRAHPELKVHLFDESGRFRQHVLCFHNRTNTRWLESLDLPVAEGDTLTLLQAVSGG